ncbi:MAG TPA: aspartate kinase [Mycobacteriales bacterium]|jgi:aspartate kinase
MTIVVRKYGGTSIATTEMIGRAAAYNKASYLSGIRLVLVTSAMGETTDQLLRCARKFGEFFAHRELDQLLALGENASAALMALALEGVGVPAVSLTAAQAGITVGGPHGTGVITGIDTARINAALDEGRVVVVPGFQGMNPRQEVTTLGRGGSDTTAVALAVALQGSRCEIHTDVDGVYTADPRVVPVARPLDRIAADVMADFAWAGARVMHPRSIELAAMYGLDIHVKSTFSGRGTVIVGGPAKDLLEAGPAVVGIAHDPDVVDITVRRSATDRNVLTRLLQDILRRGIQIDLFGELTRDDHEREIVVTVRRTDVAHVEQVVRARLNCGMSAVRVDENLGKVSIVGMGLLSRPEYLGRALPVLDAAHIAVKRISTSQARVSMLVPLDRLTEAVRLLHEELCPDRDDAEVSTASSC